MAQPLMVDPQVAPLPPNRALPDPNAVPIPSRNDIGEVPSATSPMQWTKEQALRIVRSDFERAATWRASNIEPRWQESSDVYNAVVGGEKYWEGTRIPRANLQVHQAFQQINALRPQVVDALCGGDLDFDVEAGNATTTIGQCQMTRSLLQYHLQNLGGRVANQTLRSILDKLVEDGLIYGNGVQEWGWDGPRTEPVMTWQYADQPQYETRLHPMGFNVHVPTGQTQRIYGQQMQEKTVSRFFCEPVEQVDFYIDPNANSQNVQSGEYCARRKMMTVEEISSMRDMEGFDVPEDIDLIRMAVKRLSSTGDSTKQTMQSGQGVNAPAGVDYTADPRLTRLEVIRYWQRNRHVWLLNREHVMFNAGNQYKQLPFLNWCYVNKPGSFYGYSIPELLRTDQRLIKQLLDARVDEVNLIIHPPFKAKAGAFRTSSQSKLAPGRVIETTGSIDDVERMEMGNVTQTAYIEANEAENRGQKKTGVTDLTGTGTASAGGNSANRTAEGVRTQAAASGGRVHGLVAYIEDTVISCMLNAEWNLIRIFMTPEEVASVLGTQLGDFQLDPADVLNADPRFILKTAAKMKSRAALQGGGLNSVMQYMLNPETMGLMGDQQGKTLDIEALSELVCDTMHLKAFNFYRAMTPQEQQAKQARDQQGANEKMTLQQSRLAAMGQQAHERDETQLLTAMIQAFAAAGLLNKAVGLQAPIELEAQKLEADIEQAKQAPVGS